MLRGTNKSRAEKGRATSAQKPPPTQSPDTVDVVPGQPTQVEWVPMTTQQEGKDIVADIVTELMNQVMEKCCKMDTDKQLSPFTVAWAKDAMVQVIKWQYLMRDEGDRENAISMEDTEPSPCITDSWAEGSLPVIRKPAPSQLIFKPNGQEADDKDLQQKQRSQSLKEKQTPQSESRGERKRGGRAVKLIPAAQSKLGLHRKPHPPDSPS